MGKTWLLDTETKGTGANVVPLESAAAKPRAEKALALVDLRRPPAPAKAPPAPTSLTFKVVDVMSGRILAQDIDVRAVVGLLEDVRSPLDVRIFLWIPGLERWRLLSLSKQRALWGLRGRAPQQPSKPDHSI